MRRRIECFPAEARLAWDLGSRWPIAPALTAPRRVVLCGMGGSAIGADFLRAALRPSIPVDVVRDYALPPCDEDTLLIGSSFSGNTEETIAALQSPEAARASKLVVSTGGRLTELALEHDIPVIHYRCEGPPRTAWEFGFLPVLALLGRLGVTVPSQASVDRALDAVGAQAPVLEAFASVLAPQLSGCIPFIVGAEHLAPVARRWACQVNENAKRVAFFGELPEVNHNFLLGLTDTRAEAVIAVLLDSEALSERARRRLDLTEQLLRERGVTCERVLVPGATPLDVMLRGALLGDWLSFELALAEGVDPADTSTLERFKTDLVKVPGPH
jgi:glucose/mannose-6-phosphate isomerase